MLNRVPKAHFSNSNMAKKWDVLSKTWESGMALKSVSLRPKAVMLTPINYNVLCLLRKSYFVVQMIPN